MTSEVGSQVELSPLLYVTLSLLLIVPAIILRRALAIYLDYDEHEWKEEAEVFTEFEHFYNLNIQKSHLEYRHLVLDPRNRRHIVTEGVTKKFSRGYVNFPLNMVQAVMNLLEIIADFFMTLFCCCRKPHVTEESKAEETQQEDTGEDTSFSSTNNSVSLSKFDLPTNNSFNGGESRARDYKNSLLRSPAHVPMDRTSKKRSNTANQFFFDSVDDENDVSLNNLMDENGYIFQRDIADEINPILIFINDASGPQQGGILSRQLRQLVNPIQVHNLADGPPYKVLRSFMRRFREKLRILICGGDGTVAWIINTIDEVEAELKLNHKPPIAILPLGTGNDLARVLGWGGGWGGNSDSILQILCNIAVSKPTLLDRWSLEITKSNEKKPNEKKNGYINFTNYFGVGYDAEAALQVHNLRRSRPKLFGISRFLNKFFYGLLGTPEFFYNSFKMKDMVELYCDGERIEIPLDCQGIICLNIDSYAGGVPLWSRALHPKEVWTNEFVNGSSTSTWPRLGSQSFSNALRYLKFDESNYKDGLIDVCYIRGALHLGQIKVGLSNANLLAQAKRVQIKVKTSIPIQTDGEPQLLKGKHDLTIERRSQANMLKAVFDSRLEGANRLKSIFSSPALGPSQEFETPGSSSEQIIDYKAALQSARDAGVLTEGAYLWIKNDVQKRCRSRVRLIDESRRLSFT